MMRNENWEWGERVRDGYLGNKEKIKKKIIGKIENISLYFSVSATIMVKNGARPLPLTVSNVNIRPWEFSAEEKWSG